MCFFQSGYAGKPFGIDIDIGVPSDAEKVSRVTEFSIHTDQLSLFQCLASLEDIWAPSSEFVSSSIPSWQISTAHAQPFRGARDLAFCLKVPLDSLLVWASSEGFGEPARMRRLAWTIAARIGDKYQIRLTRSISSTYTATTIDGLPDACWLRQDFCCVCCFRSWYIYIVGMQICLEMFSAIWHGLTELYARLSQLLMLFSYNWLGNYT